MKLTTHIICVLAATVIPNFADAVTIYFDTGTASEWSATGGGAVNATPYIYNANNAPYNVGNVITVTSSANSLGTFLSGGNLASFDGFWTATYSFNLPANASNVQLNFSNFFADDRAVLMLNGTAISSAGNYTVNGQLIGAMVLTDGAAAQPYIFAGPNVSGVFSSGFNVGGVNTITAIVNNTGSGLGGVLSNLSPNDGTGLGITGSISYSVPEPSMSALILCGLGSFSALRIRGSRKSTV